MGTTYEPKAVLTAVGITCVVVFALTLFAFQVGYVKVEKVTKLNYFLLLKLILGALHDKFLDEAKFDYTACGLFKKL